MGTQQREISFLTRFRRHVFFRHNVAIAICRTLHSPYPAGDGSIAILCSMLPEEPPRQMTLRQQQPVVTCMLY